MQAFTSNHHADFYIVVGDAFVRSLHFARLCRTENRTLTVIGTNSVDAEEWGVAFATLERAHKGCTRNFGTQSANGTWARIRVPSAS